MEARIGFEPMIAVLQTAALANFATAPKKLIVKQSLPTCVLEPAKPKVSENSGQRETYVG